MVQGPLIPAKTSQPSLQVQLCVSQGEGSSTYLESSLQPNNTSTVLVCKRADGDVIWSDMILDKVVALAGNEHMSVVATSESSLYFFSKCGRRLLPALVLSAQVSMLEVAAVPSRPTHTHVSVVTSDGMLRCWDASALEEKCNTSIATLVRHGAQVERMWLSASGLPVVALSTGHCFAYHQSMKVMMRIADDHFQASSLASLSSHRPHLAALPQLTGPLSRAIDMAKRSFRPQALPGIIALDAEQQSQQTMAHVETCLASSLVLESPEEFKHWLLTYIRLLVESIREGETSAGEARLREVCEYLLPPSLVVGSSAGAAGAAAVSSRDTGQERKICGHSRKLLLGELFKEIRKNRLLQKLAAEYEDLLKGSQLQA